MLGGKSGRFVSLITFLNGCGLEVLTQYVIGSEILAQLLDEVGKNKNSDGG
jgi:hypothetical protein